MGPVGGFNNSNLEKIFALTITPVTTSSTGATGLSTPTPSSSSSSHPSSESGGSSPNSSNSPTKKSTPIGAIVGAVIGGIAVLAFILGGVWWYLRKHSSRPDSGTTSNTNKSYSSYVSYPKPELDGRGGSRTMGLGEMGTGDERTELPVREYHYTYELHDGRTD
jgi:hypothetical protein